MAGLFDGEGAIWINKRKPRRSTQGISPVYILTISLVNTVYSAVDCFPMYFGGRIRLFETKHRPVYRWEIKAVRAMRFLETLLPYFRVRQKQAELGICFQKMIRPQKGNSPMPRVYLMERERMRKVIRGLNEGSSIPTTVIDVGSSSKQLQLPWAEAYGSGFSTPQGDVVCKSERDVFELVGLPYLPPEQRE
jgi:hypothetical protein